VPPRGPRPRIRPVFPAAAAPPVTPPFVPNMCEPARRAGFPAIKRFRTSGVPCPQTTPPVVSSWVPGSARRPLRQLTPKRARSTCPVPTARAVPPAPEQATRTRPRPVPRRRQLRPPVRSSTQLGSAPLRFDAQAQRIPDGAKRRRRMRTTALPPGTPPPIVTVRDFAYFY
jgi:hypothetical protein